jgi:hypothetical protein
MVLLATGIMLLMTGICGSLLTLTLTLTSLLVNLKFLLLYLIIDYISTIILVHAS